MLRWLHVAWTGYLCHFHLGESGGDAVTEATGISVKTTKQARYVANLLR